MFIVDYRLASSNSETTLKCSCQKVEREGLPCTHLFQVMHEKNLYEIPKCCILQRHTKNAKGGLPSCRKSSLYGWSTKRSRYSELTILGAEAFDIAANNHEEFCKVKDFLGDVISKRHKPNSACSVTHRSAQSNYSGYTTIGDVRDPTVVATKGAPRQSDKGKCATVDQSDGNQKERYKSYGERTQKCSICKIVGHNRRRCNYIIGRDV